LTEVQNRFSRSVVLSMLIRTKASWPPTFRCNYHTFIYCSYCEL